MTSITWPTVALSVAALAAVTVLGLTHVLSGAWLESTLSAALGLAFGLPAGHAVGLAKGRAEP